MKRVMAHKSRKGAVKGAGSSVAPTVAIMPKIKTGTTKGKTSTEISNPPLGSFTATAAPAVPMRAIAGVPANNVTVIAQYADW